MKQLSFLEVEQALKKKRTKRERFLAEMEAVGPWECLMKLIEPHYPPGHGPGRPPIGLEPMLRLYFLQQW